MTYLIIIVSIINSNYHNRKHTIWHYSNRHDVNVNLIVWFIHTS